jgi:GT2 family glycosyltransferase
MTTVAPASPIAATDHAPAVLVVLVVRNAAEWLRECLASLAAQTYPRLAVLAVDDASTDGSHELLVQALGERRVVRNVSSLGLARSFDDALRLPVAAEADFLLLMHDDTALDPEAVERMVEATHMKGVERVGVVGAKVVDWDVPRRLRDVGRSADRFGHPYTSLQEEEIDQGQFDRVLEVLSVDSCAMLVSRDTWQQVGLFDDRLGDDHADLDFCWRVHVAGWNVLMTPRARVRHRGASEGDERPAADRSVRYDEDRAALATVLKNYSLVSLVWVVPLAVLLSVVRALFLVLSRRFEEAYELLAAIGWNVTHARGTWSRRRKVQRARAVGDRELRRFTESAGLRIPRWFQTAERILEEQRELDETDEGEPVQRRLRHQTASLVSSHPVIVASFLGVLVGVIAARHVIQPVHLAGGVLPAFPGTPAGFFGEFVSGYRTTGLGGTLAASPALGGMGALSALLFGSTELAQRVLLLGLPALGMVLCYRATVRMTARPGASVLAAAAYGLSALTLWSFSEGRISLLVAIAVLPSLAERLDAAFGATEPTDGPWRFVVGVAVTLAVAMAFDPGVLLAVAVVALTQVVAGRARARGIRLSVGALVGTAVLLFPFVPALFGGGGIALASWIGVTDTARLARLALGGGPGTWEVALFLPMAALLGLALSASDHRARAGRAAVWSIAGLALAWLASAGYLPTALSNAPDYAALAAVGMSFLVAFGIASAAGGLASHSFGFRQIGIAALAAVLALGLLLQTVAVMAGEWGIGGPDRIPAAWAVVDGDSTGRFRVLWIGAADDGRSFPAPGGDPLGTVDAGEASLRYALTARSGALAIDTGRPLAGPGADALRATIGEILSGATVHGGALLAQFGVRYVVAREGELPPAADAAFRRQVDLDLEPVTGLIILRDAVKLPPAAVLDADDATATAIASGSAVEIQGIDPRATAQLTPIAGGWTGEANGGNLAVVSTEWSPSWKLAGGEDTEPGSAFGWAVSFPVAGSVVIRYGAQLPRTIESWLLAALWAAALWVTRKPVRR